MSVYILDMSTKPTIHPHGQPDQLGMSNRKLEKDRVFREDLNMSKKR